MRGERGGGKRGGEGAVEMLRIVEAAMGEDQSGKSSSPQDPPRTLGIGRW